MPVIKPVITGASVRKATTVPIVAEEDLLIGDNVALFYKPNEYCDVPFEDIGADKYSRCTFSLDNSLLALYVYRAGATWPIIYDIVNQEVLPTPETVLNSDDYVRNCVFSPDGTQFAVSCNTESAVYLYDATVRPFKLLAKLSCIYNADLTYNHAGTRLCVIYNSSGGSSLTSTLWGIYDTKTFVKLTNPAGFTGSDVFVLYAAYSPDDKQMAITYTATVDSSERTFVGIFDNRGLTPTQVAAYDNYTTSILSKPTYTASGTQLYVYWHDWYIFDVTPDSITKCSVLEGDTSYRAYEGFCPTEPIMLGLGSGVDFNDDSTEDVAVHSINLSGNYVYQYDSKIVASGTDTTSRWLSISPDGTRIFVCYAIGDTYYMRVYEMGWFAKKANYITQQFAQGVGYSANNIKAGQVGTATRII